MSFYLYLAMIRMSISFLSALTLMVQLHTACGQCWEQLNMQRMKNDFFPTECTIAVFMFAPFIRITTFEDVTNHLFYMITKLSQIPSFFITDVSPSLRDFFPKYQCQFDTQTLSIQEPCMFNACVLCSSILFRLNSAQHV